MRQFRKEPAKQGTSLVSCFIQGQVAPFPLQHDDRPSLLACLGFPAAARQVVRTIGLRSMRAHMVRQRPVEQLPSPPPLPKLMVSSSEPSKGIAFVRKTHAVCRQCAGCNFSGSPAPGAVCLPARRAPLSSGSTPSRALLGAQTAEPCQGVWSLDKPWADMQKPTGITLLGYRQGSILRGILPSTAVRKLGRHSTTESAHP